MTYDEQHKTLLHWTREANNAVADIAFIQAFEKTRADYFAKTARPEELSDPSFNPIGRVSIRRLYSTSDALVLFCTKATEDTKESCNVLQLKNAILCGNSSPKSKARELIVEAFRSFESAGRCTKQILTLRNSWVAHSDKTMILGHDEIGTTIAEVIGCAQQIIHLITVLVTHSGIKEVGTVENPVLSDNSLIIRSAEIARIDAEEFWIANFSEWAK